MAKLGGKNKPGPHPTVCPWVLEWRNEWKLTQSEAAKLLTETLATFQNWERGVSGPGKTARAKFEKENSGSNDSRKDFQTRLAATLAAQAALGRGSPPESAVQEPSNENAPVANPESEITTKAVASKDFSPSEVPPVDLADQQRSEPAPSPPKAASVYGKVLNAISGWMPSKSLPEPKSLPVPTKPRLSTNLLGIRAHLFAHLASSKAPWRLILEQFDAANRTVLQARLAKDILEPSEQNQIESIFKDFFNMVRLVERNFGNGFDSMSLTEKIGTQRTGGYPRQAKNLLQTIAENLSHLRVYESEEAPV